MKQIYLFSIIAGILLLFSSCGNGWLDEMVPQEEVETEKSLNTATEADYMLNGIYTVFRNYQYYGARYTYYGDAKGEDMQARGDSKRVARYYLLTWNAVNAPSNFWSYPYTVIRNANNVIKFTNKFDGDELTNELKNIKGVALTMRAMAHFDLVKVHGMPYTKDNGASLGVPVITEILPNNAKPARNTVAEVYTQVIKDLEDASTLISKSKSDGKLNWFATRLLLSRAYLYKGDNTKAYEISTELIAEATKGNTYRLFTNKEYGDAWKQQTGSEYFFVIMNDAAEISDSKEFISYLMHRSGYDDISLSSDFMKIMDEDPDDVRHKIIDRYSESNSRWYLGKYLSPSYSVSNIPVLRISEAYLIAAEAAIKLNDKTAATEYLNAIVTRANPEKSVSEDEVDLDRILLERRKELVGEGHRLFDAMRNNKKIIRAGKSHSSSLLTSQTKEFDWDFPLILMPIPRTEMNVNSNLVQNPGFGN
ncbi:RagB/SusD family nutrient uptake outer membrane protein [Bacteroides sp. 519]|uniref:RagB/SusD family nutrient uptake outer membrane protein n=1 Tax=Bacteroides sp. 519 TaxID=2302937 RepID=UPI0013D1F01E|nr:RagB/SusD family nutrient uptake outer membrane protein [Bacteroides sp. 519]NDV59593.1 RagB/SusD family nutrient uptake outer membrane protein [Bacteroides sp. 519]